MLISHKQKLFSFLNNMLKYKKKLETMFRIAKQMLCLYIRWYEKFYCHLVKNNRMILHFVHCMKRKTQFQHKDLYLLDNVVWSYISKVSEVKIHEIADMWCKYRQEYWSGLPCPPPEDLPDSGIEHTSLSISCVGRWVLYH